MKSSFQYLAMLFMVAAVVAQCKKDDEPCCDPTNPACPNYDPCFGKLETTAFFTIAQRLGPIGENANVFITDDVVLGGMLKFSAIPQEGATYTWILGIDTIVGGPEITTNLGSLPFGTYPNTLIVTKTPDTLCFPNVPGVAQFTRSFTRISVCHAQILGKFKSVFSSGSATDSTEIELARSPSIQQIQPCIPGSSNSGQFFVNANNNGDTFKMAGDGMANKILSFKAYGAVDQPEGMAVIDSTGIITVDYTLGGIGYFFRGRKL
jgi:hypothetical protein